MSYIINPDDYNLDKEAVVIIYNRIEKKVYKKVKLYPNKLLKIEDENIINNIDKRNFIFKIRTNQGADSIDLTKYFYLINMEDFKNYWLDKKDLTETQIYNFINHYSSLRNIRGIRIAFTSLTTSILMNAKEQHKNLQKYLLYIENIKVDSLLLNNINIYLKFILEFKIKMNKIGYTNLFYDDMVNYELVHNKIKPIIDELVVSLDKYDLQFIYYLKGCFYSLIGDRNSATLDFNKADEYDNNYGVLFGVGQGSKTYSDVIENNPIDTSLIFYDDVVNTGEKETIILSLDERFLKNYGAMILNNILALRNYHFHIHVVGNSKEIIKSIDKINEIFREMVVFFDKKTEIIKPTFSYEILDNSILDMNTYSACARFVHANSFLNKFNKNIYIIDADCLVINEIDSYGRNFLNLDIGVGMSRSLLPLMPWKRLLAGDSYFSNTDYTKKFLELVKKYILSNLDIEKAWTLDQNALAYAHETMINNQEKIKFKNIYKLRRPFLHAHISGLIEAE